MLPFYISESISRILCQIKIQLDILRKATLQNKKLETSKESSLSRCAIQIPEDVERTESKDTSVDNPNNAGEDPDGDKIREIFTNKHNIFVRSTRKMECRRRESCNMSLTKRASEPVQCKWCDKTFNNHRVLKQHVNAQHTEKLLQCEMCEATFPTEDDLRKHTKVKHKPIKCTECPKTFKTKAGLKRHVTSSHHPQNASLLQSEKDTNASKTEPKCGLCDESFQSKRKLSEHNTHVHGIKPFDINVCSVCGKAFTKRQSFLSHSATHTKVHKFLCTFCGKIV